MRLAVILRAIYDPANLRISRARSVGTRRILVPGDRRAWEEALRLRSARILLLALGLGSGAELFLHEAKALGADELIHLQGEGAPDLELDGSPWPDWLAEGFERNGSPDLVLMGHRLNGGRASQLGPRLAERLGWPLLTGAHQVEVDSPGQVRARCVSDKGTLLWEAPLPCLITLEDGPRTAYAPLTGIMPAGQSEVEVWTGRASTSDKTLEIVDIGMAPERRDERTAAEPRRLAQELFRWLRRWEMLD